MKEIPIPVSIPHWPNPAGRDLIQQFIREEIAAYEDRQTKQEQEWIFLTESELEARLNTGNVAFGLRDARVPAIESEAAIRSAFEAFTDGIVLVFIDNTRITNLEEPLKLTKNSVARFVRLNSLRGY